MIRKLSDKSVSADVRPETFDVERQKRVREVVVFVYQHVYFVWNPVLARKIKNSANDSLRACLALDDFLLSQIPELGLCA